jgi:hypothetical protein
MTATDSTFFRAFAHTRRVSSRPVAGLLAATSLCVVACSASPGRDGADTTEQDASLADIDVGVEQPDIVVPEDTLLTDADPDDLDSSGDIDTSPDESDSELQEPEPDIVADVEDGLSDDTDAEDSDLPSLIRCLADSSYVRGFRLPSELDELSGLASGSIEGVRWWMHNDSGGAPLVYGVDTEGGVVGSLAFADTARDVEDMAAGSCGNDEGRCLYVADIGDNLAAHASVRIHRVSEVDPSGGGAPVAEHMTIRYTTGAVDAEALIVRGQEVAVLTKEPGQSRVFEFTFEAGADIAVSPSATIDLASLPAGGSELLTGADWRAESGLLLRTYTSVAWLPLSAEQAFSELADALPIELPVGLDLQGESIAWYADGGGYFHAGEGRDVRSYSVRCADSVPDGIPMP